MDNARAKKIIIKVLIILILLILLYVAYWYIQKHLQNDTDILIYKELEKKEIGLSNPIIDYINIQQDMGESTSGNNDLYIDIRLPQINAITEESQAINNSIKKQYEKIQDYYKGKEKYISYKIDYEYEYVWSMRYLYITIKTVAINESEATSNITYKTYIYNEKEDKQILIQDLLIYFGATKEKLIKKIKLVLNFNEQLSDIVDNINIEEDLSLQDLNESSVIFRASIDAEEYIITFSLNELNTRGLITDGINEKKNIGNSSLNIKLPKIKLETDTVVKLNTEMQKIYNDIIAEIGENGNNSSYKVNYQYGYSENLCYMYVNIFKVIEKKENEKTITTAKYITYIYDISGDKNISKQDLLSRYKVNDEVIINKILEQNSTEQEKITETKIREYVLNKENTSIISFNENEIKLRVQIQNNFYEVTL